MQALHDIITSKKHRTWSKTYESIMFKHIDLCVEMKKRNYGKEALMQYRNMCQQVRLTPSTSCRVSTSRRALYRHFSSQMSRVESMRQEVPINHQQGAKHVVAQVHHPSHPGTATALLVRRLGSMP